jgi:hypothetical protein
MRRIDCRQDRRQRRLNRCVHDKSLLDAECAAGVRYDDVQDTSQRPIRYICRSPESTVSCKKRQLPTPEEVDEKERLDRQRMERMLLVSSIIDTQVSGTFKCPFCDGQVQFSVASNGHRAVRCTNQCVLWIE